MRSRKRSKEGFLELILELALRVHVRRDVRRCCVVSETDEVDEVDETFFFVRLVAPPECDEGWNLESVTVCLAPVMRARRSSQKYHTIPNKYIAWR